MHGSYVFLQDIVVIGRCNGSVQREIICIENDFRSSGEGERCKVIYISYCSCPVCVCVFVCVCECMCLFVVFCHHAHLDPKI